MDSDGSSLCGCSPTRARSSSSSHDSSSSSSSKILATTAGPLKEEALKVVTDLVRHVPLIGAMTTRNFDEVLAYSGLPVASSQVTKSDAEQ